MKFYKGTHMMARTVVLVNTDGDTKVLELAPSLKLRNHSPTGFEWGYCGSGPAQLALAILLDVTGDALVAQAFYQDFKQEVVAAWGETWEIYESDIRTWLAKTAKEYAVGGNG